MWLRLKYTAKKIRLSGILSALRTQLNRTRIPRSLLAYALRNIVAKDFQSFKVPVKIEIVDD